jgi:hypothetical protein
VLRRGQLGVSLRSPFCGFPRSRVGVQLAIQPAYLNIQTLVGILRDIQVHVKDNELGKKSPQLTIDLLRTGSLELPRTYA